MKCRLYIHLYTTSEVQFFDREYTNEFYIGNVKSNNDFSLEKDLLYYIEDQNGRSFIEETEKWVNKNKLRLVLSFPQIES